MNWFWKKKKKTQSELDAETFQAIRDLCKGMREYTKSIDQLMTERKKSRELRQQLVKILTK